jgi:hypothetical protein
MQLTSRSFARHLSIAALSAVLLAPIGRAAVLFDNGPIVTNPTGGTGAIAGLPISNADGFTIPGSSFIFSTTGIGATISANTSVADDFTVPAGQTWDLDTLTAYAFQTSQTTATITTVRVNLWTAPPFDANSPPPLPDTLPQPVLGSALLLPAGPGTFVAHRESPSGTSTVRPVFAYTVSLDGLPDQGRLGPGTYWLEWSMNGAASPSSNVFVPLVSPRTASFNTNARLDNIPFSGSPLTWFEGREGFVDANTPGRPYALPFTLGGTAVPEPASLALVALVGLVGLLRGRRRAGRAGRA